MENKKEKGIMNFKYLIIITLFFSMIYGSFAYYEPVTNYSDNFPVIVIPKVNGFIKPSTQFEYQFVFATDENCVDDVYTKTEYLTTDKYGVASTSFDLSGIAEIPSYLCEYRDGSLRKTHILNERLFMKQITENDIVDYGFIKNFTDTTLNDSDIGNFGYIKDYTETDPTITLQKLQNLTLNDYHNLGGTDRVLNKSEIEQLGFLLEESDYCKDGLCDGDVTITGDLILIGSLTNVNATTVNTNGSIIPDFDGVFDLGSTSQKWNNIYANTLYGNIAYNQIQNVPAFLLEETDPSIISTYYNQWCRGTGDGTIACDVVPVVDTVLSDSDIGGYGYIKSWTETDPIYASDPASTITATDIYNWATAYSWGNHANEGYITDPNDAVDSNELDNLCNVNGMVLKRLNNTWVCSDDIGFIPVDLLTDYNFTDNSDDWNLVYFDYYNNTNGYLTEYTETDPIFIESPSYNINNTDISDWNTAYVWGNHAIQGYLKNETDPIFTTSPSATIQNSNISNWNDAYSWGNHNLVGYLTTETDPYFSASPSNNITNVDISNWNTAYNWGDHSLEGYLTNETDPLYIADKDGIVFFVDTNNWDKNVSDDFDGNWNSLSAIPVGFLDGIDNDTKYYNLSEFVNDMGYLTSFTETDPIYLSDKGYIVFMNDTLLWDKDYTDDFDGNWSSLIAIPSGFADGIDDNTEYENLSEFYNDVGYIITESDPIFISSPVYDITNIDITNWEQAFNWGNHANAGYLTTETDPFFVSQMEDIVYFIDTNIWDKNVSDDFDYEWSSLLNVPSGFGDNIDNDTQYFNLSEFNNDVGYITYYVDTVLNESQVDDYVSNNGYVLDINTNIWDKNVSDDFDYEWSSLLNVPSGFLDGIDDDTQYFNLSEFNNDVGYITSFTETDPFYISDKSNIIFENETLMWDKDYSDDFNGDYNNLFNTPINVSYFTNDVGYLTSFTETDPIYISDKSGIVFFTNTTQWDTNVNDDFDYEWSSLLNIPSGFLDGVDNDTKYYTLSEFANDVGYITGYNETDPIFITSDVYNINQSMIDNWNFVYNQINDGQNSSVIFEDDTTLWDKDYTDDFNGSWYALINIPSGFGDNIDNDTQLTEAQVDNYVDNNGYYVSGDSPSFDTITTNDITVNGEDVCLANGTNCAVTEQERLYDSQYVNVKDEFTGESTESGELGELGWVISHWNGGSTSYENNPTTLSSHPAIVVCNGNGNYQSACKYSLGENIVLQGGEIFTYVINSVQDSGSTKIFGITDYLNNPIDDIDSGIFMVISDTTSTITGYVENNDNRQSCDTGVTITDNNWYQLEMRVKVDNSGVDFYVNDIYKCSVNNNNPTNQVLGPKAIGYYNTFGNNNDLIQLDLFHMSYKLPSQRWD